MSLLNVVLRRTVVPSSPTLCSFRYLQPAALRSFASSPRASGVDEEELEAARRWLASFDPETIPKSMCDISFSRSSGPGGQNVNKVSSKATLRLPLDSLLPMIPSVLHSQIRSSRYCAEKSNSLVIQADDNRKQNDNVHSCFSKLHNLILEVGRDVVPGETSNAQRSRVKNLQKAENEARLRMKKTHGSKKSARRGGGRSDY